MTLKDTRLEDRFKVEDGRVLLSGSQALLRIMLEQRARDVADGLNTAGFVSGYRGTPLGGFDQQLCFANWHDDRVRSRLITLREYRLRDFCVFRPCSPVPNGAKYNGRRAASD